MSVYFFDASAIVKYFHGESGSNWVKRIVDGRDGQGQPEQNQVYIADISLAEVPAAFAILARNQSILRRARDSMYDAFLNSIDQQFHLVGLTTDLAFQAGELTQEHPLKGYDAIQLAVALATNDLLKAVNLGLVFVSSDRTLLRAAQAEGLETENPYDHAD